MFTSPRTRAATTRRFIRAAIAVVVALLLALPGLTVGRSKSAAPSAPAPSPSAPLVVGLVVHDLATGGETPASLVQELVGPGAVVSNVQHSGALISAGTFTGGTGIIGFERGLLLGSGEIAAVVGPMNDAPDTDVGSLFPGDPDLEILVGTPTLNASVLEFDLECPAGNTISFQYVFSSDEYDDSVGAPYNDGFACFVNGQNIALIPGTSSPVSIQSVNCDYPYESGAGVNCGFYITNDCNSLGLGFPCSNIATEMDGLTGVFTATGALQPGPNHIKLVIADHFDEGIDSNVFIRGQSFDCASNPPVFGAPSPCGQVLDALALMPFSFAMSASSMNGLPGESVSLAVAGDAAPLAGGTFTPPLPAGSSQTVSTQFSWIPTLADVGLYHLDFTATDQLLGSTLCSVTIRVTRVPGTDLCQPGVAGVMACPCGNSPSSAPRGCDNSSGTGGARLMSTGEPSVSQDTLQFRTVGQRPFGLCILFQGNTILPTGVVYGQGVRCSGGLIKRLFVKTASGGSITAPQAGDPSVHIRSAQRGDHLQIGSIRLYAVYYRDNTVLGGCPASSVFNITQTQEVLWGQ